MFYDILSTLNLPHLTPIDEPKASNCSDI